MIKGRVLHHYPKSFWQWVLTILDWTYSNVLWGMLPILIALALIAFANGPFKLPADLALSLVVLSMTIAATGMDALKEYRAEAGKDKAQWLRRGFLLLLVFASLLAAVCTPSDLFRSDKVNQSFVLVACASLLIAVLPLGIVSHVLGLQSRDAEVERVFRVAHERFVNDPEYLQRHEAREQQLQEALVNEQSSYNGIRV